MTNQEINEAIMKACGWRRKLIRGYCSEDQSDFEEWRWIDSNGNHRLFVPDYCNDLNAMRDAELSLSDADYRSWHNWLTRIRNTEDERICKCVSAPARQRAEAFLRTLGLWKD